MTETILQSDCNMCFGLCCVALHFAATEGFPEDKTAGQPCINLQENFRCSVHDSLSEKGLKGCIAYECMGAGQKASKVFTGRDWRQDPDSAQKLFQVFLILEQFHELLWYLREILTQECANTLHEAARTSIKELEELINLTPDVLQNLDVAKYRTDINVLLVETSEFVRKKVSPRQKTFSWSKKMLGGRADLIGSDLRKTDLRGANLRGAYLIAADLRGADLTGADFIGADLRDADFSGANLTNSIFLTQAQINVARGDASTKLSSLLNRPINWSTKA